MNNVHTYPRKYGVFCFINRKLFIKGTCKGNKYMKLYITKKKLDFELILSKLTY